LHTAVLQVALGIATLLLAVPVILGATHQGVAMILFTVALYLVHALRRV
jgi:cytochrome c oxidase assembly protein subunit 15